MPEAGSQSNNAAERHGYHPSLLTDYRTPQSQPSRPRPHQRSAARLSTCPPVGPATSLPKSWSAELTVGGERQTRCASSRSPAILLSWSQPTAQPLPQSPAELYFGQPAYDLAKDARSPSSGRHSSWHVRMLTSPRWRKSTEAIHRAWRPTASSDLQCASTTMCRPTITTRVARTPLTSSCRLSPTIHGAGDA